MRRALFTTVIAVAALAVPVARPIVSALAQGQAISCAGPSASFQHPNWLPQAILPPGFTTTAVLHVCPATSGQFLVTVQFAKNGQPQQWNTNTLMELTANQDRGAAMTFYIKAPAQAGTYKVTGLLQTPDGSFPALATATTAFTVGP